MHSQTIKKYQIVRKQQLRVRTGHGTTDWFQIRKGVRQGCIPTYLTYMQSTL